MVNTHRIAVSLAVLLAMSGTAAGEALNMTRAEYEDRVKAVWFGQFAGALMGFQFEHKASAVARVDKLPSQFNHIIVDDDWYYEMIAIRAFEKHGTTLTAEQLGEQWKENNAGAWGSSEQARLLLARSIKAPDTGHPRYNRLWFSIGPQFSADVYGAIAPGLPNLAGKLARNFGHLNGYAEGTDGAVFMAGMVSLGFVENDPKIIVKKAAQLIHPKSPYRQCLDLVIAMAERGATPAEISNAVEDRWHSEYPATNNAVANGGLTAMAVWFGEGNYLQTANLAFQAADFTDADCNAANAAAVVGAMKGMKAFSPTLIARLGDRIEGKVMGGVPFTPPVNESFADLAKRTAAIGEKFLQASGGTVSRGRLQAPAQSIVTQPAELFQLADLMQYWNPEWKLLRAGFGGAGGGMSGLRGNTYLNDAVLATYPRDEVRGLVITRSAKLGANPKLTVEVGVDRGRGWALDVWVDNERVSSTTVSGGPGGGAPGADIQWQLVETDLKRWAGGTVQIRLMQRVLLGPAHQPGNAYWKNLRLNLE